MHYPVSGASDCNTKPRYLSEGKGISPSKSYILEYTVTGPSVEHRGHNRPHRQWLSSWKPGSSRNLLSSDHITDSSLELFRATCALPLSQLRPWCNPGTFLPFWLQQIILLQKCQRNLLFLLFALSWSFNHHQPLIVFFSMYWECHQKLSSF